MPYSSTFANLLMIGIWLAIVVVAVLVANALLDLCWRSFLETFAKWLEKRLEELEFHADRTNGGLLDGFRGLKGHSLFAQFAFAVVLMFLILGPNLFWKPGETPSYPLEFASWCFGLIFPIWIFKHLLQHGSIGICWIGVMVGMGGIPAFFSGSPFWTTTLFILGSVIYVAGRVGNITKPHLQKVIPVVILILAVLGCAALRWNFMREDGTGVSLNNLRLAALVGTLVVWLAWAKWKWPAFLLPGAVCFGIVALWSVPPVYAATPWALMAKTIRASIATWWREPRPSFTENAEPVALTAVEQFCPMPPHHGMALALALGVLALISWPLSGLFVKNAFARFRDRFRFEEKLPQLKLLEDDDTVKVTSVSFRANFVGVLWHTPIQACFVPALLILRLHHLDGWGNKLIFFGVTVLWWAFLGLGAAHTRFGRFREVVDRYFFQSGQFMLSLTLIALGGLQYLGVHYVTVVVEAAGWWVARTFLFLYFLLWVYEYWVNRQLTLHICELLTPKGHKLGTPFEYTQAEIPAMPATALRSAKPAVPAIDLHVQIHGAAKIAFIAQNDSNPKWVRSRRTFDRFELFDTLVEKARSNSVENEVFSPEMVDQLETDVRDIRQRINGYFAVMNFLLLSVVISMVVVAWSMPGRPIVVANRTTPPQNSKSPAKSAAENANQLVELRPLMFDPWKNKAAPPRRVILIAASGGGTRAALYTASILDGLSQLDAIDDVVFTSGVSGGGASLAYFAMHRDHLSGSVKDRKAEEWNQFHERLSEPFIQEVLEDWWELRMANGTSLGKLLAESFNRHFHSPNKSHESLGWCSSVASGPHPLAVIWNTTISGEFPANVGGGAQFVAVEEARKSKNDNHPVAEWDQRFHAQLASSYHSGGRLVFTNLKQATPKDKKDPSDAFALLETAFPDAPREHMRFEVVRDTNLELTSVAALAANFPPVFPNAAVDLEDTQRRFWVTDGGLMDNRGVLSLLLCLKQSLSEQYQVIRGKPDKNTQVTLPEIHVIVIEGSATSIDYSHDRGAGANSGAKAIIANQLMLQLKNEVNAIYGNLRHLKNAQPSSEEIQYHYLTMPTVLRARGGLGTHWMLPNEVTLSPTESADPKCPKEDSITLKKCEMQKLIRWLNTSESTLKMDSSDTTKCNNLETAREWIKQDSLSKYCEAWGKLRDALSRQK